MFRDYETINKKSRQEWEYIIYQWVHDETARQILTKFMLDGLGYERIAEDLEISRATVYNKVSKFLPQVFKHCD